MKIKYLMVLLVSFLSVISVGCATVPLSQEGIAKYVANFDYTPSSQAALNSAGVTFAIGNVAYQSNSKTPWYSSPQFVNLDKAIKEDLSGLLIAKGFSIRGPFDSYDLIPYSDKKAVDLWLIPTLELSLELKDNKTMWKTESIWTPQVLVQTGNVEVTGKIILELREIVTRELMWSKTIPFTKFEFPYSKYPSVVFNFWMDYAAKEIEKQYPDLMATISKLIDPEEMQIIKKQAQELKSKKGY